MGSSHGEAIIRQKMNWQSKQNFGMRRKARSVNSPGVPCHAHPPTSACAPMPSRAGDRSSPANRPALCGHAGHRPPRARHRPTDRPHARPAPTRPSLWPSQRSKATTGPTNTECIGRSRAERFDTRPQPAAHGATSRSTAWSAHFAMLTHRPRRSSWANNALPPDHDHDRRHPHRRSHRCELVAAISATTSASTANSTSACPPVASAGSPRRLHVRIHRCRPQSPRGNQQLGSRRQGSIRRFLAADVVTA